MKMRLDAQRWALGSAALFFLFASTSAITVRQSKNKSVENEAESEPATDKLLPREGLRYSDDSEEVPVGLAKRSQNLTTDDGNINGKSIKTSSSSRVKTAKSKEDSPISSDIGDGEIGDIENEFNREVRGDKNPRIYYDDTLAGALPEGKSKDGSGKYYYPKNYMNTKFGPQGGQKKNQQGKRIPDHHVDYNEGVGHHSVRHEYPVPHGHSFPVEGHHHLEQDDHNGPGIHHVEHESPFHHGGIEEHTGKSHTGKSHGSGHVNVYGGYHHGSYRHSLGDKVDVLGRALRVLVPSALLVTGVSALFPNRVHVPTTPNKYRQKRSVYRRRRGGRRGRGPIPAESQHVPHLAPEIEDIPSHILQAEHRFLDSGVILEPEQYGTEYAHRRYAPESHSQSFISQGFDPFGVFKGPGPEHEAHKMEESIRLPGFEGLPEMQTPLSDDQNEYVRTRYHEGHEHGQGSPENENNYGGNEQGSPEDNYGNGSPESTYGPGLSMNVVPPTINSIPDRPTTEMSMGKTVAPPQRRRKTPTRKPPMYLKESSKHPQYSTESQKQNYLVKEAMTPSKQSNPVKAEEEFMSTLQNLVTPDVAKAIVENKKQEPPKDVDLSPDGPVMGLLSSYAQHEKDSPLCQKRALCELAVKGRNPQATKFESFLWNVATLVPDVFSEMYDLQEVFHSIREDKCAAFQCGHPNLDLQVN